MRSLAWQGLGALIFSVAFLPLEAERWAYAAITTAGNVSPVYNNTDPWNVSNLIVGNTASGSMTVNGGSDVIHTGTGIIANGAGASTSSVTVSGGGSTWTNTGSLSVGNLSTATLGVTSGGSVSSAGGTLGTSSSGNGTVTVAGAGSIWTSTAQTDVGSAGTGTLNVTGGGTVSFASPTIGNGAAANGMVTISGAGSAFNYTGSLWLVGFSGTGTLSITGGGKAFGNQARIGTITGSNGTATVGGGTGISTWTNTNDLRVGDNGTGALNITGGGSVSNMIAILGNAAGGKGTVTVGGGTGSATWTNSSALTVGNLGAGTRTGNLNINSGGLVSATALEGGNATSSVNFNGRILRISNSDSASNSINLFAGGGTFDISTAATTFTVSSAMVGAGGLTKTGVGKLTLSGANGYSGNTTVNTGTLTLSGSGSFASSPTISVASGATFDGTGLTSGFNSDGTRFALASGQTLKGTGTVVGGTNVRACAAVAPGNSVGTLSTGDLLFTTANSSLVIDFDLSPSPAADLLVLTGAMSVNSSTLQLSLFNVPPTLSATTFLVVQNDQTDAILGTFGWVIGLPPNFVASLNYAFAGTDTLGRIGNGNDLAITLTGVAIPEARGWLMLGVVAVGAGAVSQLQRWRRLLGH